MHEKNELQEIKYSTEYLENLLLQYKNSLNLTNILKQLKTKPADIFTFFLAACASNENLAANIHIKDLMKFCDIKGRKKEDVNNMINDIKISTTINENNELFDLTCYFFSVLFIDKQTEMISVKINPDYEYILNFNYQDGNYTKFLYDELKNIRSVIGKMLYVELKKWRLVGKWTVSINDFEKIFLKDNEANEEKLKEKRRKYKEKYIDKNIELFNKNKYFNNLICTVIKSKNQGNAITGFEFTFIPEKVLINVNTQKSITDDSIYKTLGNQNLMLSEYEQICKLYNKIIVNGVIDRIINKPYMGCLKYETIKEWCEEAKKSANKKNVNNIESYYDNYTKEDWDELEKKLTSN